jgi:hypothetical protein
MPSTGMCKQAVQQHLLLMLLLLLFALPPAAAALSLHVQILRT